MLTLGSPLEISLVGVFDTEGRGSRRDIDLPMHKDGQYSQALAEQQGGLYIAKEGIDIVGLYCINEGDTPCYTLLSNDVKIDLKKNQALIFDNHALEHGREGNVGNRLLMRFWIHERE